MYGFLSVFFQLVGIYSDFETGLGSLKVIKNYIIQSGTRDFLLTFHSNHRPISHRFRDKHRFPLKIAKFSHSRIFNTPAEGIRNLVSAQGVTKA